MAFEDGRTLWELETVSFLVSNSRYERRTPRPRECSQRDHAVIEFGLIGLLHNLAATQSGSQYFRGREPVDLDRSEVQDDPRD